MAAVKGQYTTILVDGYDLSGVSNNLTIQAQNAQIGGSAQPVILVGPDGVPLVSVTVSPFMQSILDDADAAAVQASLGLSADSIASIPEAPVMRGSDAAIGANQGTGQLIAIRQQIKMRRARLRIRLPCREPERRNKQGECHSRSPERRHRCRPAVRPP